MAKAMITQRQLIQEAIDDVRDSTSSLRSAENDLLDSALHLADAENALRNTEIELLLGPTPVDPDTTKPLTVPQREAYIEQQTAAQRLSVAAAERSVRAHQASLRIAQEDCRANRIILSALARIDDDE